jgi:hypothetical protein
MYIYNDMYLCVHEISFHGFGPLYLLSPIYIYVCIYVNINIHGFKCICLLINNYTYIFPCNIPQSTLNAPYGVHIYTHIYVRIHINI